jgi:hypothetical protein
LLQIPERDPQRPNRIVKARVAIADSGPDHAKRQQDDHRIAGDLVIAPRAPPEPTTRRIANKPEGPFGVNEKRNENNSLEVE